MPGLNPTQQDIDQFVAITQASHEDAEHFLTTGTTLQGAIEDFYAAQNATDVPAQDQDQDQDEDEDHEMSNPEEQPPQNPSGPRTLGGQAADSSLPAGWGQKKKTVGRVGDWGDSGSGSSGPRMGGFGGGEDDDDDEDEDEQKRGQEFYTGGEKSGLAVQNPDGPKKKGHKGLISDILKQAAEGGKGRQAKESAAGSSSAFRGSGNTLGSEDDPAPGSSAGGAAAGGPSVQGVSSSTMDNMLSSILGGRQVPPPPEEEELEPQSRVLTFWQDGFSIEDGPLFRYDDPKNKDLLEAIKSGQAPRSIFDVEYNQSLEIMVNKRTNEPYRAPPKVNKPFEGGGNRLGSAAPEISGSGGSTAGPSGSSAPSGQTTEPSSFEVDTSKPNTSIQLRLGDGTKIVAKVNLTHTIGDLRSYVAAPDSRPFVLQTTFPNKELSNFSETVESAKLQNAVVVQRFT